jgi:hypothetical protein
MSEFLSYEAGVENELPKPQWQKPSLEEEMGELERHAEESEIDLNSLVEAFKQAELQELSDEDWENMENCDSRDTTWTSEQIHEHLEGKRDFKKIEDGLSNGATIPAPVVLYREGHKPNLLAGNSRLLGCRALGLRPTVLAIHMNG